MLRVRRPKTNVSIELPLLPAVAQALTAYLRWERPPARSVQHIVFLGKHALRADNQRRPFAIVFGTTRGLAGISTRVIGAHVFATVTRADRLIREPMLRL